MSQNLSSAAVVIGRACIALQSVRDLVFGMYGDPPPSFICASSEGSGKSVNMHRFV